MAVDTSAYEETMPVVDEKDLLQEAVPMARVPVEIEGDATVYLLPARRVQTGTDTVNDVTATEVLSLSNKRMRALLVSTDGPMLVSSGATSFTIWPQNVPYEIRHSAAIRVKAATAASTTKIGWTAEYWAD